jgi:hypothetical protein
MHLPAHHISTGHVTRRAASIPHVRQAPRQEEPAAEQAQGNYTIPLYSLPPPQTTNTQQQGQERKYFDSGDYALSKAGKAGDVGVTSIGVEHPSPDTIPHLSSSPSTQTPSNPNGNPGLSLQPTHSHSSYVSGSPVKEGSILQRGMSVDDQDGEIKSAMEKRGAAQASGSSLGVSPSSESDAVPIRQ